MKKLLATLCLFGLVASTFADPKADLDDRIRKLTANLATLQANADKSIPATNLANAKGIVLMERTKAGFIFAYQGGGGIALAKDKAGNWGPAAFLSASEASLGFQIGGQQAFIVILLMDTNATRILTEKNYNFGGEASGTAGDSNAGVEGNVKPTQPALLVYSDVQGLYGGATVKGGAVKPDDEDNKIYYGQYWTMKDILFDGRVKQSETAAELAKKINELARPKN